MRPLIPALLLAVALVGVGATPAIAGGKAPAPAQACISLAELPLPSVCDLKAGTLKLAADLSAQIGLSVNATLSGALRLVGGISASLPNVLSLLLSLPPLIAKLLCL